MALPRKHRLVDRVDFLKLARQGRSVSTAPFTLRYFFTPTPNWRAAIVISSKAVPLATKRNLLRRVITAWLSKDQRLGMGANVDLVIGVKPDCAKLKTDQIKISLEELFRKANIV